MFLLFIKIKMKKKQKGILMLATMFGRSWGATPPTQHERNTSYKRSIRYCLGNDLENATEDALTASKFVHCLAKYRNQKASIA
jgi:predicted N-acyltransferase